MHIFCRCRMAIVLLGIAGWSACSKSDFPPPVEELPVFMTDIQNPPGDSLTFTAGLEGIYLFTDVERGNDNVLVMSGRFAPADCGGNACANSLRFEFRNNNEENTAFPGELFFPDKSWPFKSPNTDPPYFETLRIEWIKPDGVVLRSDWAPQDSSHCIILDSEPWESNEKGQNTWKMTLDFSVNLSDTASLKLTTLNGTATIAVGYR